MEKIVMATGRHTVVLFEDDKQFGTQVEKAIRNSLPAAFKLVRFKPGEQKAVGDRAHEDRVRDELSDTQYKNVTLIVSDRDLSKTQTYSGLSEAVISKIAAEFGIPMCLYARGVSVNLLDRQKNWGDNRIVLDSSSPDEMAEEVAVLAAGFLDIDKKLKRILALTGAKRPKTPAAVMAEILDHPELTDQVSLYGSGDQKMVAEILPYATKGDRRSLRKRLPSLLGYWLFDSILRYPGLLVNEVAASSYLNIDAKTFREDVRARQLFAGALYNGPFRRRDQPYWWRSELDDLIADAGCKDGRSFAEKKLKRKVAASKCSIDSKLNAGWYCMATKKPVSRENSRGNISWFPQGADLARINKIDYEKIGPWLGLF